MKYVDRLESDSVTYDVAAMKMSTEIDVLSTNIGVLIWNKENRMIIHISQVSDLIKKLQTVAFADSMSSSLGKNFEDRYDLSSIDNYKETAAKLMD